MRRGIGGRRALSALGLGPFDIAIDLRYESDTRRFLQNADARVYAGFGRVGEFPFLDVVVPRHELAAPKGASQVVLTARDFVPTDAGAALRDPDAQQILEISARGVLLDFEIEGAASPKTCGVSSDERVLGVGVEAVSVRGLTSLDAEAAEPPLPLAPIFRRGWHGKEPWGAWSKESRAYLSLLFPSELSAPFARIDLTMRGQVNPNSPEVRCKIRARSESNEVCAQFTYPSAITTTACIIVPTQVRAIALASTAFELLPGHYKALLRLYLPNAPGRAAHIHLILRGLAGKVALLRRALHIDATARGIVSLPLTCTVETAGENLRIELESDDGDVLGGAHIESVSFTATEQFKPNQPAAHMGERASQLVLQIAQMFSTEPPFGPAAPHAAAARKLCEPEADADIPQAISAARGCLQSWRDAGYAVVGIALGCNSAIRKWPFLHFVELVHELQRLEAVRAVFIGGPADQQESLQACTELGLDPARHSLCGLARLDQLGFLLGKLDLFIGNDTGITHFAGKAGIRTICIKAGTSHPREWGPIGENASWIYRDEPCAPCGLHDIAKCKNWVACMRDILPADVLALALPEVQAVVSNRRKRGDPPFSVLSGPIRKAAGSPKYVIHIGPPKTGSKYLQSHLYYSRPALAAAGIFYPDLWWTRPDQIFHLPLFDELRRDPNTGIPEKFAQLNAAGFETVVLSCEGFHSLRVQEFQRLRAAIGDRPVEIVYYCRRWSDRLPSTWRSHIEMGHSLNLPEFYARFWNPSDNAEVNYSKVWDVCARVFGRESLRLVSYSNLRQQKVDLAEHFFKTFLGWDQPISVPPGLVQSNVSPDLFDTEIIRALNHLDFIATRRIRLNMRVKFRTMRGQVDTKGLTDLMAEHVAEFEIPDGAEPFRSSFKAISAYADCLVSKEELGNQIFERAANKVRYIRPDYLLEEGAARRLNEIYRELEQSAFKHPEMS